MHHVKKAQRNPFIKNLAGTGIGYIWKLQAMHTLSNDYGPLCLIPEASLSERQRRMPYWRIVIRGFFGFAILNSCDGISPHRIIRYNYVITIGYFMCTYTSSKSTFLEYTDDFSGVEDQIGGIAGNKVNRITNFARRTWVREGQKTMYIFSCVPLLLSYCFQNFVP